METKEGKYKLTLAQMPYEFTGQEFSKRAQRNGIPYKDIVNGSNTLFLHQHAERVGRKTWKKKDSYPENLTPINEDGVDRMINFLKSKGYKILKPIQQWEEI